MPNPLTTDTSFWDKTAPSYSTSPISDPAGYQRTLTKTITLLTPTTTVLELGSGTGTTALTLSPHTKTYLATDISPTMISIANAKPKPPSTHSNLTFFVATAEELLPTRAGDFDVILAFNYLHLVRDLPGTLSSVRELLKPGGLFVSKTICIKDMAYGAGLLMGPVLPVMRWVGLAPFVASFDARGLRGALEGAGLEVVEVEYHGSEKGDARPFVVARRVG